MSEMTYEEFQEYVRKFDDNFKENVVDFKIICKDCGSDKVALLYNNHEISCGSEYTGCWTSQEAKLVFKCCNCGKANIIIGDKE